MAIRCARVSCILLLSAVLAACGGVGEPAGPAPMPVPQPKPSPAMPAELSQSDAETTCLVRGARKFAIPLASVRVMNSKAVDAGYLVKLDVAGAERTCIIARDGFVRSLR